MSSLTTITALTTVFTPAPGCSTIFTYEAELYNLVSGGLLIQDILVDHPNTASCFPPGWGGFGRGSVRQVYSPGACPVGYATATSGINGAISNAICCPSSFSYSTTFSIFPNILGASAGALFEGCLSTYPSSARLTTVLGRTGASDFNTTSVSGPLTMWAQPMSIEYQQTDLALFTATSTSTSSTSTATASASLTAPTASATSSSIATSIPSSSSSSSAGISGGAIAGIVIGAAAVIGLIIGFAVFFAIWRRKSPGVGDTAAGYQAGSGAQKGTLHYWADRVDGEPGESGVGHDKPVFGVDAQQQSSLHSHSPAEMAGQREPAEMDAQRHPVEMPPRDVYEM